MRLLFLTIFTVLCGWCASSMGTQACERLSVCELDATLIANQHTWQLPVLNVFTYHTAFSESRQQLGVFMLCNVPGHMSCIDADAALTNLLQNCQHKFLGLVDGSQFGRGQVNTLFGVDAKLIYVLRTSFKYTWGVILSGNLPDTPIGNISFCKYGTLPE